MKIALHDSDNTGFPNLALMKISARAKQDGLPVSWYNPMFQSDAIVYSSKVFTFTKQSPYLPEGTLYGGTGYVNQTMKELPDATEHIMPDYDLYGIDYSMGFLTRGCIRK